MWDCISSLPLEQHADGEHKLVGVAPFAKSHHYQQYHQYPHPKPSKVQPSAPLPAREAQGRPPPGAALKNELCSNRTEVYTLFMLTGRDMSRRRRPKAELLELIEKARKAGHKARNK